METVPEPFRWSKPAERAALLVAQGRFTTCRIAKKLRVARSTLWRWRKDPEFVARVAEHLAELKADSLRVGIADQRRRIADQNDRWNRMRLVIRERAAEEGMDKIPGGRSGILVRKLKTVGGGDSAQVVEEYAVDTGLLREMRELEKHVAIELHQWQVMSDPDGMADKSDADLESIAGRKGGGRA